MEVPPQSEGRKYHPKRGLHCPRLQQRGEQVQVRADQLYEQPLALGSKSLKDEPKADSWRTEKPIPHTAKGTLVL